MPLANLIPMPTWRDVVDILFLVVVVYHLYEWFRETRALRVIIGLLVLGGIYSVAKLWGLFLTTWVFQILWQVLLILLLILFQSEIRQVLERVSPLRFLRSRRAILRKTFAQELAQVLFDLAAEKTGALIVITRDDNPGELIHGGQSILALPEPSLIKSIFNRYSPAHDGAIVLTRDRLTQMGCILPLSEREDLPEQYGTRHRAALGLSERTDAICLVVSEERAEVSSVVGGKFKVWKDVDSLAQQLEEWTVGPQVQVPTVHYFLQEIFVHNWRVKLIALAVVSTAWLILASQQEVSLSISAPIQYVNLPSNLVLQGESAPMVGLTLSGRRTTIRTLNEQDIQVQVDLGKLGPGVHIIRLSDRNVDLPVGVRIERLIPQQIQVVLESVSHNRVPNQR
jgi:diadenylate cyclase